MFNELLLERWPPSTDKTLQAWNSADALLAAHIAKDSSPGDSMLLVNDAFGALACALHQYPCVHWSDSFLAQRATTLNLERNFENTSTRMMRSNEALDGTFDFVLIKIPKTLSLLEYQLRRIKPHLTESSKIVAGGMVKHLSAGAFKSFEKIIGPVTTSLAEKKARLIFASNLSADDESGASESASGADQSQDWVTYTDQAVGFPLHNHAGLFSRNSLDLGTRFFLSCFDQLPVVERTADLACGNGVLGLKYQSDHPDSKMAYLDESFLALESARKNFSLLKQNASHQELSATFVAGDAMADVPADSLELILCNPPFHQGQEIGRGIAARFFQQSKVCLEAHGELWIVANRHLGYEKMLKALFGHCQQRAANQRFVILQAKKR